MKAVVLETDGKNTVVLTEKSEFVKIKYEPHHGVGAEIELKPVFLTIRRRWLQIAVAAVLIFFIGNAATYAYYYNLPCSYVHIMGDRSVELIVNKYNRIIKTDEDYKNLKHKNVKEGLRDILAEESASDEIIVTLASTDTKAEELIQNELQQIAGNMESRIKVVLSSVENFNDTKKKTESEKSGTQNQNTPLKENYAGGTLQTDSDSKTPEDGTDERNESKTPDLVLPARGANSSSNTSAVIKKSDQEKNSRALQSNGASKKEDNENILNQRDAANGAGSTSALEQQTGGGDRESSGSAEDAAQNRQDSETLDNEENHNYRKNTLDTGSNEQSEDTNNEQDRREDRNNGKNNIGNDGNQQSDRSDNGEGLNNERNFFNGNERANDTQRTGDENPLNNSDSNGVNDRNRSTFRNTDIDGSDTSNREKEKQSIEQPNSSKETDKKGGGSSKTPSGSGNKRRAKLVNTAQ